MNFIDWISKASSLLSKSRSSNLDAEIILEFVTGKNRAFILAFGETLITIEQEAKLNSLLNRRKEGEPIAYLIGEKEFWSLPFYVSAATIIPRQDTECLVEIALSHLPSRPSRILDLGTGTGAIALALASERPDCRITAVDIISESIELTLRNMERLSVSNVELIQGFWFNSLQDRIFDFIVSNPPYINSNDQNLLVGDLRFEPLTALVSANEGIADLCYIISNAYKHITTGGFLLVEHGWNQGSVVRKLFINAGFCCVKTYLDYCNNERITLGRII